MTAARLAKSPGQGFTKGASCGNSQPPDSGLALPDPSIPDESDDEGEDAGLESEASTNAQVEGGCQSGGSTGGGAALALLLGVVLRRRRVA